jgi:hypothetical protein
MANAMLGTLHHLRVDIDRFGDSTGVMDLNSAAAATSAEAK